MINVKPVTKDPQNLTISLLLFTILITWGYVLWDKNETHKRMTDRANQIVSADSAKRVLHKSYHASLTQLDALTGKNNQAEGELFNVESHIEKLQSEINSILNKQRLTAHEEAKAESLIQTLNTKIAHLAIKADELTRENKSLRIENNNIIEERNKHKAETESLQHATKTLMEKLDVASTLNVSKITVTPLQETKRGREKITYKANKANKMLISFDVDNRIIQGRTADVYISIVAPDNSTVMIHDLNPGTFNSRNEGLKSFSAVIPVELETGKSKHVEFQWKKTGSWKTGNYTFQLYHNGYKIGEQVVEVKKSGSLRLS